MQRGGDVLVKFASLNMTTNANKVTVKSGKFRCAMHVAEWSAMVSQSMATIETHYSELGFTPSFRKAWETAHARPKMQTTDGTAQPEWLDRFRKVRTPNHHKFDVHTSRGTDSNLVADVPGFEPGFPA